MAATHNAIKKRMILRNKQMKWLLENFVEPVYIPDCSNNMSSLSDTFSINNNIDTDTIGYNPCGITMTLLNYEPKNTKANEMSYYGVATVMRNLQSYLPIKLRSKVENYKLWNPRSFEPANSTFDSETVELLEQMIDWIMCMKLRIQNDLTNKYMLGGKVQYLELLKRRYKNNYSEKVEQEVVADVQQETNFNLVIEDYTPDEDN